MMCEVTDAVEELNGMDLCVATAQELMPLNGTETVELVASSYLKASNRYPEQWAELTLATLKSMVDKSHSISPPEKMVLLEFLSTAAKQYDEIQS